MEMLGASSPGPPAAAIAVPSHGESEAISACSLLGGGPFDLVSRVSKVGYGGL